MAGHPRGRQGPNLDLVLLSPGSGRVRAVVGVTPGRTGQLPILKDGRDLGLEQGPLQYPGWPFQLQDLLAVRHCNGGIGDGFAAFRRG